MGKRLPKSVSRHHIVKPAARLVAVADARGEFDERELLDRVLAATSFDAICAPAAGASRAVILVDLGAFALDSPVLPSRRLVEHLVDRLAGLGWVDVQIASSADSSSTWAENRNVAVLADLFGYRYETARGTPYDIADLSEDLLDAGFPDGSVLAASTLARPWLGADLRLLVAKAGTDQRDEIVLAANTLLAAFPLTDKEMAYRIALDAAEVLSLLLERAPPGFTVVDLCGVAHGSGGRTIPRAAPGGAVVAGSDLMSVDLVAAAKLGADPGASSLWRGLVARRGVPIPHVVEGSLAPLPGVELPDRLIVESTRARHRSAFFGPLLAPWIQESDTSLFPLKNPLDMKVYEWLAPRLSDLDAAPANRAALIAVNLLCAYVDFSLTAWRANHDKDKVLQRHAGISPETTNCRETDYRLMEQELALLEEWLNSRRPAAAQRISAAPRNAAAPGEAAAPGDEFRWSRLNRAVVFEVQREYPVPFDEFAAQVDISKTIQLMNDYVGGTIVVVEHDGHGRPLRQIERNLYLPQPNYLAWWGGSEIDVSKIESIHHGDDRQRMYWKTIKSENGSAVFDDGIVTFEASGSPAAGKTRVTLFGRQLFSLPPAIESLHLERYPAIEDHLTEHAYRQFFDRTFANFEALLDGRNVKIGVPLRTPESPFESTPRPIDAVADLGTRLAETVGPFLQRFLAPRHEGATDAARTAVPVMDEHGFMHFDGRTDAPGESVSPAHAGDAGPWARLVGDYAEAILRDLAQVGRTGNPRSAAG